MKAHSLFGHIDDSPPKLNKFICTSTGTETTKDSGTKTTEVSPEYTQWVAHDQALITLINATLSSYALTHVVGSISSKDLWLSLEKHYSSNTRSNILELRRYALYAIKKLSSESIEKYTCRIKYLINKLAATSISIDEEEVLVHTLNGLPTRDSEH